MAAVIAVLVSSQSARADWGSLHYGGYQPGFLHAYVVPLFRAPEPVACGGPFP